MAPRAKRRSFLLLFLLAGVGATSACLLADPPADLPVAPLVAPEIVRVDVQPPITSFLDSTDVSFSVPVIVDPREPALDWQFFIDHTLLTSQTVDNVDGGALLLVTIGMIGSYALPPDECHTLELSVGYPGTTSVPSDSVAWFYSATRSFAGCSVFDAGVEDAGIDAPAEGGD